MKGQSVLSLQWKILMRSLCWKRPLVCHRSEYFTVCILPCCMCRGRRKTGRYREACHSFFVGVSRGRSAWSTIRSKLEHTTSLLNIHESSGVILYKSSRMTVWHISNMLQPIVIPYGIISLWSTLVQGMAWCLVAPSHYLNQCWHITWVQFHRKYINVSYKIL